MTLESKTCVPCEGGVERLDAGRVASYLGVLSGWTARDEKIHKGYAFRDFVEAMAFVNRMAAVAEHEGHHPDFRVHWNLVDVTIWTHAIDGLSENDFILAAKIDAAR